MAHGEKPRWVEMTKQVFVSDEEKGKSGERTFLEPVSKTKLTFKPSVQKGKAITHIRNPKVLQPYVAIYRWWGFNLEIENRGLPRFKRSRKVAKSVRS